MSKVLLTNNPNMNPLEPFDVGNLVDTAMKRRSRSPSPKREIPTNLVCVDPLKSGEILSNIKSVNTEVFLVKEASKIMSISIDKMNTSMNKNFAEIKSMTTLMDETTISTNETISSLKTAVDTISKNQSVLESELFTIKNDMSDIKTLLMSLITTSSSKSNVHTTSSKSDEEDTTCVQSDDINSLKTSIQEVIDNSNKNVEFINYQLSSIEQSDQEAEKVIGTLFDHFCFLPGTKIKYERLRPGQHKAVNDNGYIRIFHV